LFLKLGIAVAALLRFKEQPMNKHESVLTDQEISDAWVEHGLDECDPDGFARIIEQRVLAKLAEKAEPVAYRIKTYGSVNKFVVRADVAEEQEYKLGEIHGPENVTVDALYTHPPATPVLTPLQQNTVQHNQSVLGRYGLPYGSTTPALLEAAKGLLDDVDGLIGESGGVYGLHLNGDPSPWGELIEGGRFERLTHLEPLRAAIEAQKKGTV
jgi:hypothetical protein